MDQNFNYAEIANTSRVSHQISPSRLPQDALNAIKILDEVLEFTSTLNHKLMSELNRKAPIHLDLDKVQ